MVLDYERNENIMKVSINSIIGFSIKSNKGIPGRVRKYGASYLL